MEHHNIPWWQRSAYLRQEEIGELRPLIKKQNVVILPPTPICISDTAIYGAIELFPSLPPNKNRDGRVSL